jgi:two-component system sensor histidine kinase AlgZ
MNRPPPTPAAPGEEPRQLYLPNFCAASTVLVIILICELTALLLALARNEAALGFWSDLGLTSMFLLWIALCGAALLCLLRDYLSRQSVAVSAAVVLTMTVTLVTVVSAVTYYFGSGVFLQDAHWSFLGRNAGITFVVTALALRYFYVTHEWRHNVELQAKARVHALQARIRPHFLFNSMNTIAALTRSNPARAEEAVLDLAELFRANLNEKRNQISLAEEISVARTYQRMEQLPARRPPARRVEGGLAAE